MSGRDGSNGMSMLQKLIDTLARICRRDRRMLLSCRQNRDPSTRSAFCKATRVGDNSATLQDAWESSAHPGEDRRIAIRQPNTLPMRAG
jgi:hypothetical protein